MKVGLQVAAVPRRFRLKPQSPSFLLNFINFNYFILKFILAVYRSLMIPMHCSVDQLWCLLFFIFKELIQNAEDAGATQVKFLHDKHSHGTDKLYNEELAKFQVLLS